MMAWVWHFSYLRVEKERGREAGRGERLALVTHNCKDDA